VVGKRAIVPRGTRVGRNVRISSEVRVSDFGGRVIRTGTSVERGADRPLTDRSAIRGGRAREAATQDGGGMAGGRATGADG
jgi:hypothetical protein